MKFIDGRGLSHFMSVITNIFAPKESPAFTGTPTAPTATAGTTTNQIATTSFVNTVVSSFGDINTFKESVVFCQGDYATDNIHEDEFVYIENNSSLSDGLYQATTDIDSGDGLISDYFNSATMPITRYLYGEVEYAKRGLVNKADKTVVDKFSNGLCPMLPNETTTTKYLRQDGSWSVPPDTTYETVSKTSAGLCPTLPNETTTTKFLRQDGSWQQPSYTSKSSIVDLVYPVGSIYMSVNNTSPATLFGGTWAQLKDRFLLGAGDTYTAGNTGGAASVSYTPAGTIQNHVLTTAEIPSHNHTFTGKSVTSGNNSVDHSHTATVGNQSVDHSHTVTIGDNSASHTHTYDKSSGAASTTLAASQIPAHSHSIHRTKTGASGTATYVAVGSTTASASSVSTENAGGGGGHTHGANNASTNTGSNSVTHKHTATCGIQSKDHTHTVVLGNNSVKHTHSVTADGTIGSTGSGGGHNHDFTGTAATIATMPPYLVVYMWKRTA